MIAGGYDIKDVDMYIYTKFNKNKTSVIIYLYVDDLLILRTDMHAIINTKNLMSLKFDMKDLGETSVILGIKLNKTKSSYMISQEQFLKCFGCFDVKPVLKPYDSSLHLKLHKCPSVFQSQYAQMIGSLMYLMNCSRPGIAYAMNRVTRYTQNLNKDHWKALNRIMRYLRGAMDCGLHFLW